MRSILLTLFLAGAALLSAVANPAFPPEGRWSIATGWEDDWPSDWHHAKAERSESVIGWTIHHGKIELPQGAWILRDESRPHPTIDGLTELRRRWTWTGREPLDRVTLSVRLQIEAPNARPFLPGISYYDNHAGRAVDASRIPVIGEEDGARGFYEEHRYPLSFAAVEAGDPGALAGSALHSLPSLAPHANRDDQWWSLGVERKSPTLTELALLSGPCASNGQNSIIKANQRGFIPYPDAWLAVPPGAIIEKTFFIQTYDVARRGSGFQQALWANVGLCKPSLDGFPPLRDVIRRKLHDTTTRWIDQGAAFGIDAFPDTRGRRRCWLDMGWAGQSEAVAYPLLALKEVPGIENPGELAQRAVDFITTAPFDKQHGFAIRYDFDKGQWEKRTNPLSQGQAMNNLLNALRVARARGDVDTSKWEAFLKKASAFHADRILGGDWKPVSTNEAFLIAPLAQAGTLLDEPRFLKAARKAADHYGERHLSMDEPYWGGTLDARCEDKEGARAALQGFLTIYEQTKAPQYLGWARHAADVIVSYVYVWDVTLPPGRLADHAFRTRGWTSVSVQNMHLDVYGVLCAPALWRLGELTGDSTYQHLARLMVVSCGQLVDPTGRQGEQLHQTNYAQHYRVDAKNLKGTRGDYVESWDIFWITAHFLTAVAQFEEMNVDWASW